jgi:hypothetical protein
MREEDMMGGDQEKLADAGDGDEEPSGPFSPWCVFGTDGNAEGGGEGLTRITMGSMMSVGLRKGTDHLNGVQFARLDVNIHDTVVE